MSKPVLLDLFSGAGGAARGYQRAGFHVVGVDINLQPRYAGDEFVCDDAMSVLDRIAKFGTYFDAIHASPPCQAYSIAAKGTGRKYPDLLAATRERLQETGVPWVIENVPGAPMRADFKLCGCQFGLKLRRLRYFETSWDEFAFTKPCLHEGPVVSVVGHGTPTWVRQRLGYNPTIRDYREAMGINWMTRAELSQAIPPAYTEHIGRFLMAEVERRAMMAPSF